MTYQEFVYGVLAADEDVTEIVGSNEMVDDEGESITVYWIRPSAPEVNPTLPYLVYTLQTLERPTPLGNICPLCRYEIRIEAWSPKEGEATTLIDAVENALQGYSNRAVGIDSCRVIAGDAAGRPEGGAPSKTFSVWLNTAI